MRSHAERFPFGGHPVQPFPIACGNGLGVCGRQHRDRGIQLTGKDFEPLHVGWHAEPQSGVQRVEFRSSVELPTSGSPIVMSLVEGASVTLDVAGSPPRRFNYAETFVVPAAAGIFRLISHTGAPLKVVLAGLKPEAS